MNTNNDQHRETILDLVFESQFSDSVPAEWRPRACGIMCLRSVLGYQLAALRNDPWMHPMYGYLPINVLINLAVHKYGAYGPSGWIHDGLLNVARAFGMKAERAEKMGKDDITYIPTWERIAAFIEGGSPVIVSTKTEGMNRTKFHMVLLVGVRRKSGGEDDGKILGFYNNDPEALTEEKGKNLFVSIDTLLSHWRRMAIFISIPKPEEVSAVQEKENDMAGSAAAKS